MSRRGALVLQVGCCNHIVRAGALFEFPRARIYGHRGGLDAADHQLLRLIETELPSSCDTVVIGSGDHIFAPVARQLRARGLRVEVIACAGSISHELYRAADACHLLEVPLQAVSA